jgi:hypothetical protein
MPTIREIVYNVLQSGYLTLETEEQLRQLFARRYDLDDIEALTRLQQAATVGRVKQQSRELEAVGMGQTREPVGTRYW